jgi:hypothetical protein
MRILIIIISFFIIGALFIISNNNLEMYRNENLSVFGQMYMDWLGQLFSNTQKISGEAIKLNWIPNETIG